MAAEIGLDLRSSIGGKLVVDIGLEVDFSY
jgi:hypothetical protein